MKAANATNHGAKHQALIADKVFAVVTKIVSILEDDIDGSEASETVRFSLDGRSYEIDLNSVHATELRANLLPYRQAGRSVRTTRRVQRNTQK